MSSVKEIRNPWVGLSSYVDPGEGDSIRIFCGREDEVSAVERLIDNNTCVILYGQSGVGKSSLLNAGVFPKLRALKRSRSYTPMNIRIGNASDEESLQDYIISIINDKVSSHNELHGVLDACKDKSADDYLWNYFARHRFYDVNGDETYPVIVLDQFEEILRNRKKEAAVLLKQINYMSDECNMMDDFDIDGHIYRYCFNFRFVISIREDDLYRLEGMIDRYYLFELKGSRFYLEALTPEGAKKVILHPASEKYCGVPGGLFKSEDEDEIVNMIICHAIQEQEISTCMLSLICSRIFVNFLNSDSLYVSISRVAAFIKDRPLERFYNEATKGLLPNERAYIENNLIDATGEHRTRVKESDLTRHLSERKVKALIEGQDKILDRVFIHNKSYVELLHDCFCPIIEKNRESRKDRTEKLGRFFFHVVADCFILAVDLMLIMSFFATQTDTSSLIVLGLVSPILLFCTYMINVARLHHDRHISYFLLPQIASAFLFYSYFIHHPLCSIGAITPYMLKLCCHIFMLLNVWLFVSGISNKELSQKENRIMRWRDYVRLSIPENRYAPIAMIAALLVSGVILLLSQTDMHRMQKDYDAGRADSETLVSLAEYYMKYDRDDDQVSSIYKTASEAGMEDVCLKIDSMRAKAARVSRNLLPYEMRIEAIVALSSMDRMYPGLLDDDEILLTDIGRENIDAIISYYESLYYRRILGIFGNRKEVADVVMRWKSVRAYVDNENYGNLGYQFWQGEFVERDLYRAFEIYKRNGSHINVINCYIHGWGVDGSLAERVDWAYQYLEEHGLTVEEIPGSLRFYVKLLKKIHIGEK